MFEYGFACIFLEAWEGGAWSEAGIRKEAWEMKGVVQEENEEEQGVTGETSEGGGSRRGRKGKEGVNFLPDSE